MLITLTTRCGCKRELNLPQPLPPYIELPMSRSTSLFHLELQTGDLNYTRPVIYDVRVFERYGTTTDYVERLLQQR